MQKNNNTIIQMMGIAIGAGILVALAAIAFSLRNSHNNPALTLPSVPETSSVSQVTTSGGANDEQAPVETTIVTNVTSSDTKPAASNFIVGKYLGESYCMGGSPVVDNGRHCKCFEDSDNYDGCAGPYNNYIEFHNDGTFESYIGEGVHYSGNFTVNDEQVSCYINTTFWYEGELNPDGFTFSNSHMVSQSVTGNLVFKVKDNRSLQMIGGSEFIQVFFEGTSDPHYNGSGFVLGETLTLTQ
ncbi:hypothetical protein IJJ08_03295 [bacterium]|nr:hypothetical protein [bacterium]